MSKNNNDSRSPFREPSRDSSTVQREPEAAPAAPFGEKLSQWIPGLSDAARHQLQQYNSELLRFGKVINLISPTTIRTAESVHFADSILASKLIAKNLIPNAPVYDLGSGNGFPGLVMAIFHPDFKFVLVERDTRKAEFLKHTATTLGLKNVLVEAKAVEAYPAQSMKNVVSRGFAPLHKAMLLARKQVASGGRYFHLKSDGWANELASVPSQLFSFWNPSLLGRYRIPESTNEMAVVLTEKIAD